MDARTVDADPELVLLSCCLGYSAKAYYEALEYVSADDFSSPALRAIFRAIGRVADEGGKPDHHLVWAALGEDQGLVEGAGGRPYLMDIAGIYAVPTNASAYAKLVQEKAQLAQARRLIEGTLAEMDAGKFDLSRLQESLFRMETRERQTVTWQEAMQQVHLEAANPQKAGLPFPWREVQWCTRGMQPGAVTILAAETSVGKTAAALEITDSLIKLDKSTLYLSLEMTPAELGRRMGQRHGYDVDAHYRGNADTSPVLRLENEYGKRKPSHISSVETVEQIPALIRRHKPDLLIVDHMGRLRGQGKSEYERVSSISWGLKTLAQRYDLPILALCQLSRRHDQRNKVPSLDRLRDSGRIEEDASIVIMVHRDRDENQILSDKGCFVVAKSRGGKLGKTEFTFNGDTQLFTLIDKRWEK